MAIFHKIILIALLTVSLQGFGQTNIGNYNRANVKTLLNVMADSLLWEGCMVYKDSIYYTQVQGDSARFRLFCDEEWSEWVGGSSEYLNFLQGMFLLGRKDWVTKWVTDTTIGVGAMQDNGYSVSLGADPDGRWKFYTYVDSVYDLGQNYQWSDGSKIWMNPTFEYGNHGMAVGQYVLMTPLNADNARAFEAVIAGESSKTLVALYGSVSGGAYNYSLFADDGSVYVKDSIGINALIPLKPLDVNGTSLFRDTIYAKVFARSPALDSFRYVVWVGDTLKYFTVALDTIKGTLPDTITELTVNYTDSVRHTHLFRPSDLIIYDDGGSITTEDYGTNPITLKTGDVIGEGTPPSGNTTISTGYAYDESGSIYLYTGTAILRGKGYLGFNQDTTSWVNDWFVKTQEEGDSTMRIASTAFVQQNKNQYTMTAEDWDYGAYLKILGSDGSKDSVFLMEDGSVTITRTGPKNVTITGAGTIYTMSAEEGADGAYVKILGQDGFSKDSVYLKAGDNISIDRLDNGTIEISSTASTGGGSGGGGGTLKVVRIPKAMLQYLHYVPMPLIDPPGANKFIDLISVFAVTHNAIVNQGKGISYDYINYNSTPGTGEQTIMVGNMVCDRNDYVSDWQITGAPKIIESTTKFYIDPVMESWSHGPAWLGGHFTAGQTIYPWGVIGAGIWYSTSKYQVTYREDCDSWVDVYLTYNVRDVYTGDIVPPDFPDGGNAAYDLLARDTTDGAVLTLNGSDGSIDNIYLTPAQGSDLVIDYLNDSTITFMGGIGGKDTTVFQKESHEQGVWLKLARSDGEVMDSVLFYGYGNVDVYQGDDGSITFDGTGGGLSYSLSGETGTGGAYLKLMDSDNLGDSVKLAAGTNMTSITRTDANTITFNVANPTISFAGMPDDIAFEFADIIEDSTQTYTLDISATFEYVINTAVLETDTGTLSVAITINGTNVTNLSAVTANSSAASTNATAKDTVSSGQRVRLISSGSTGEPTVLRGKLKITRL